MPVSVVRSDVCCKETPTREFLGRQFGGSEHYRWPSVSDDVETQARESVRFVFVLRVPCVRVSRVMDRQRELGDLSE